MTAGDTIEVRYTHDDLGSGVFFCKAGEESSFDPGGYESSDDKNGVDGGGRMIDVMTRKRWHFSCPISWDMTVENELFILQDLMDSTKEADWTIDHVSGTIWAGRGKPVGEIPGNGGNGTIPLKLGGGGKMSKL